MNFKKILSIVITVFVLIIIGMHVFILKTNRFEDNKEVALLDGNEINDQEVLLNNNKDWKTYSNEKYGFEISYPYDSKIWWSNYALEEGGVYKLIIYPPDEHDERIGIENPDMYFSLEIKGEEYFYEDESIFDKHEIGDTEGFLGSSHGRFEPISDTEYFFLTKNSNYFFKINLNRYLENVLSSDDIKSIKEYCLLNGDRDQSGDCSELGVDEEVYRKIKESFKFIPIKKVDSIDVQKINKYETSINLSFNVPENWKVIVDNKDKIVLQSTKEDVTRGDEIILKRISTGYFNEYSDGDMHNLIFDKNKDCWVFSGFSDLCYGNDDSGMKIDSRSTLSSTFRSVEGLRYILLDKNGILITISSTRDYANSYEVQSILNSIKFKEDNEVEVEENTETFFLYKGEEYVDTAEKINLTVDKDSFEILKSWKAFGGSDVHYAKDKNYVFFSKWILEDANPETFNLKDVEIINNSQSGKSAYVVYRVYNSNEMPKTISLGFDEDRVYVNFVLLHDVYSDKVKVETGNGMGSVISDDDTNWYLKGSCRGGHYVPEKEIFKDNMEDWTKEKYLEEYLFC